MTQRSRRAATKKKRSTLGFLHDIANSNSYLRLGIVLSSAILTLFGLIMIFSASSILALEEFGRPSHYLVKQLIYVVVGIIVCLILLKVPFRLWTSTAVVWIFWGITFFFLVLVFFLGMNEGGAQRWIGYSGISLQPSEFAKISQLLVVANVIARFHHGTLNQRSTVRSILLVVGTTVAVILLGQSDLGTSAIILLNLLVMLYIAGVSLKLIGALTLAAILLAAIAIAIEPYRMQRLLIVFNPWADPLGDGYQTIQGFYAFGSGGLFGLGLGESRQKFRYLPAAHTDFIFAIIGEETGFIGSLFVILLFAIFIACGFIIAWKSPSIYHRLLAGGATSIIAIQACINILCVVGLFPITGKPLPFLSYGGSSIISVYMLVGIILAVSYESSKPDAHEAARERFKVVDDSGYYRDDQRRSRDVRRRPR